jgi:hypothetical protein
MKTLLAMVLLILCVAGHAAAADSQPTGKGLEIAKTVTKITGIAMSPLLGTSAVGAYDWWQAKTPEQKAKLPWYGHPSFWVPALLLVGVVAGKDTLGAILPPGAKKPLDVAETIENKVSGIVAGGAVIPLVATIFHSSGDAHAGLAAVGFAAMDFSPLLNVLTIPLAVAAYVFVWLVGHVINVLILVSPFGVVDAALKSARTSLLGLLVIVNSLNPWVAAVLSLIIIVIAYFVAGWSFRVMVYGSVFTWDFISRKRKRFKPAPDANWMFAARKIEKMPIRTYGKLVKTSDGQLTFEYRPWLVMAKRTQALPEGRYAVGRGLFYPDLLLVDGEKTKALLTMPPRYKGHEQEVAQAYGLGDVRDTGLLRGIRAIWRWFTRSLFGGESKEAEAAAATA